MKWFQSKSQNEVQEAVGRTVRQVMEDMVSRLEKDLEGLRTVSSLTKKITELRENLETMRIEKARKQEEMDKQLREVEHKVGLERKRVEFEVEHAAKTATLKVQQENLAADKTR